MGFSELSGGKGMKKNNGPQRQGQSSWKYTLVVLIQSLLMVVALLPARASVSDARHKLLQIVSAGHVLGFDQNGVYLASGSHLLKVEFAETNGAQPAGREYEENDSGKHPVQHVAYSDVWPGVDLAYDVVDNGIIESTWEIAKGANPDQISLRYNRPVSIERSGSLKIDFETGWITESAPVAWQEINGQRVDVQVAFKKVDSVDDDSLIGFELGQYDPAYPLLIDPLVNWHTYMGSEYNDFAMDLSLDDAGNIYVLGESTASWGSPINLYTGGTDVFVAKLSSNGTRVWNTFMGVPADGDFDDMASALAVDGVGNVYITGTSHSSWGEPAAGYTHNGADDAFVAKLDTNGNLLWNVFLGSDDDDNGEGIAVDSSGNVYVSGSSMADWYITEQTLVFHHTSSWVRDVFVAKLNTSGALIWNRFMGGEYNDISSGLAVDSSGSIYVTGYSYGPWLLDLNGETHVPVAPFTDGGVDVFVARLNNDGTGVWNTFMGSSEDDISEDIAVDGSGSVYVTGRSFASWGSPVNLFVTPAGGVQPTNAFAARLDGGGILQWNTFMSGQEVGAGGQSIIADNEGNLYVTGISSGDTWGTPVIVTGDDPSFSGGAFVVNLSTAAGTEQWNAFLGGGFSDNGMGIALDGSGDIYVAGSSIRSWGNPVNLFTGSNDDVFVARICNSCFTVDTSAPAGEGSLTPESRVVLAGAGAEFDVTAEPGYTINTVTGCGGIWAGTNPYMTGAVSEDCTVTATFSADAVYDYTVSTASTPSSGGTFTPSSVGVNDGDTATLEIVPNTDFTIDTVTGCGGSWTGSNPYTTGSVTGDCTVIATFSADVVYDYTVSTISIPETGGTLTPSSVGVNDGDTATLEIVPNAGYTIDTVTGCGGSWTGTSPYTTGSVTENCTVTATFNVAYDYTISTASIPAEGGTFNPSSMGINEGYAATLEIVPNPGFALISATGCDGDVNLGTNPATYDIYWASADCTITATFSDNSHRVSTAAASGHVFFWPEFRDVIDGETASFDVDVEVGSTLDTVTGCGGTWTGSNPYLTGPITEDCTITATIVGETDKSPWLLFMPAITGGHE